MSSGSEGEILQLPGGNGSAATIELVRVPPGWFLMGSDRGLPHAPEGPVHRVEIPLAFWMSRTLVTQQVYEAVMGSNPSQFPARRLHPVESVTWDAALAFCERLTALTGRHVGLPSEAEWEYAYRAGTASSYFFGDDPARLADYAWFEENSGGETQPVGLKAPNPWGLLDLPGNVWEWCQDVWHPSYDGAPADGTAWMSGAGGQGRRCVRGGAWDMDRFRLRASYRSFDWRDAATARLGFRVTLRG